MHPYLLFVCINVLPKLLKHNTECKSFKYHRRCGKTMFTHLCFADDLMIFAKGDKDSAKIIKKNLYTFSMISRMAPNTNKSNLFIYGVDRSTENYLKELLGFRIGYLPIHYFGAPPITTKMFTTNRISSFEPSKHFRVHILCFPIW